MALTSHPPGTSPASSKCNDSRIRAPESPLPGSPPPAPAVPHESGSLLKSRDRACVHRVLPSHEHSKSNNQCEDTYELISKWCPRVKSFETGVAAVARNPLGTRLDTER